MRKMQVVNLLFLPFKYRQKMSKSCRKSILCRPRRGRCCLGGTVFVVLHFRHLRIALSSAEALRGVSTNSQRLSPNQALHLSSMRAEHQTHRCCAVSFSSPQNLPSADSCLPTSARQLPRAVWWPQLKREIYTLLSWQLTPSSFSLPRLISRFLRGNSGQGPTESSLSSSSVSVPTGCSSAPPAFPLRSLPPSLIQGTHCQWPEQSHQYPPVEPATTPPPLPPRSPPQKTCIWQPLLPPIISTAGLLSFPPPHQLLSPSAPQTHSRQRYTLIISTAFG